MIKAASDAFVEPSLICLPNTGVNQHHIASLLPLWPNRCLGPRGPLQRSKAEPFFGISYSFVPWSFRRVPATNGKLELFLSLISYSYSYSYSYSLLRRQRFPTIRRHPNPKRRSGRPYRRLWSTCAVPFVASLTLLHPRTTYQKSVHSRPLQSSDRR